MLGLAAALLVTSACSGDDSTIFDEPQSSIAPTVASSLPDPSTSTPTVATDGGGPMTVSVDLGDELATVHPEIRGLSGVSDPSYIRDVGATVNSWGGNTATRYNYLAGHYWNAGRDWEYRNGNYDVPEGDAARGFLNDTQQAGAKARLAVPTLGWIARDDDNDSCSFPTATGCDLADDGSCDNVTAVADPNRTSMVSAPEMVGAWVQSLSDSGIDLPYLAMDNEPELWGYTHYDVHPSCPTYEEILNKYTTYADVLRKVVPDAALMGPVMCCWYSTWNVAPGAADDPHAEFLSWFMTNMRRHDEEYGTRTLDMLDIHYYPQSNVYNDEADPETAARRLRSTRALYDGRYVDESWIGSTIELLPRVRSTIESSYPGTGLAISEWNFGADGTMNGALAIADVLGIYGREGVDMACYWRYPEASSPGYFAFKMHGNYDGQGSSFEGTALSTTTPDVDVLGTFAVVDPSSEQVKVLLINKDPDGALQVKIEVPGFGEGTAKRFTYSPDQPAAIVSDGATLSGDAIDLNLQPYSITLVELTPA